MLVACSTHPRISADTLADQAEREVAALLKRVRVYDEPGLVEYLAVVAGRVGGVGVKITVIADPTLGAFAMPVGRVFVHTGLLSAIESEAQLAMILARESAHDTSRLTVGGRMVSMSTVALSPTAAALLGLDLRLAIAAAIEGYGTDGERAADSEALRRLMAAEYDARAGAHVFQALAADEGDRRELAEIFFYGNRARLSERDEVWRELLGGSRPAGAAGDDVVVSAQEFARRMRPLVRENAALDARAGRFALAGRQLDRVLASDPNDAVAQFYYAERYRLQSQRGDGSARTENTQRAIERYRRAVELDPRYAEPFRQLALLYYQRGDLAQARAAFERYLAAAGDAPDARRIREYLAILGQ
jgi:beta-barrel assembly-enhancing protease